MRTRNSNYQEEPSKADNKKKPDDKTKSNSKSKASDKSKASVKSKASDKSKAGDKNKSDNKNKAENTNKPDDLIKQHVKTKTTEAVGRKREVEEVTAPAQPKNAKKSKAAAKGKDDADDSTPNEEKPRLTTPDLEFDYDRSQLRDNRPTPGRERRPRYSDHDIGDEFRARFYIPKLERPKGVSKHDDSFFRKQALADPTATFHHLYVCHKKGRNGSPTYDEGGFQLDWEKVDKWMKPQAYNKSRMVKGMERAVNHAQDEEKAMYKSFFVDGKGPDEGSGTTVKDYIKDHVSKDLNVPWHQIDSEKVAEWEKKGFKKINANEWWSEPTKEERKRFMKMMSGASLRKDL